MKRIGKVLIWTLLGIAIFVILIVCFVFGTRLLNANKTKITTENGIQENIMVEIGGIKQYLQIRGKNKNNPIVVFLHGGPGSPMAYFNYTYQLPLEEDYTFVSWDQRGCGRTYYANPEMNQELQLSKDILLSDLDNVVDYLRNRFKQDKVIIMGHSWGTVLGSQYIQTHPEKVLTYLGISQGVDAFKGYNMAANEAMLLAKKQNQAVDANRLSDIVAELSSLQNTSMLELSRIIEIQKYSGRYMPYEGGMSALEQIWKGATSPYMSLDDAKWFLTMSNPDKVVQLQRPLVDALMTFDLNSLNKHYDVPIYYISGEADWINPKVQVEEYYKSIEAPDKEMLIIENAGHSPFVDQPKLFQEAVKSLLSRKQ